jgi:DNA-binding response OmpR family regulator
MSNGISYGAPTIVLVVEDNFFLRWNLADHLREAGYVVTEAERPVMSRCLLNIAKRSLLRLMLSCVGLASKHAAG